jgi:hypothetical protein
VAPPGNRCLEAKNGNTTDGTPLVIEDCTTTPDEGFTFTYAGFVDGNNNPCYIITNANSHKVVGVSAGKVQNGTPVILWDYLGHADQFWCLAPTPVIIIS